MMNQYEKGYKAMLNNLSEPLEDGHIRFVLIIKDLLVYMDDFNSEQVWLNVQDIIARNPNYTSVEKWDSMLNEGIQGFLDNYATIEDKENYLVKILLVVGLIFRFNEPSPREVESIMLLTDRDGSMRSCHCVRDALFCEPIITRFFQKENMILH